MSDADDEVKAFLDQMIEQSTGDVHEALVLCRREHETSQFWANESYLLAAAIGSALKTLGDGPVASALKTALAESFMRTKASIVS